MSLQRLAIAFGAGIAAHYAFAPMGIWLLMLASLVVLFALWAREASPSGAAEIGFAWGAGLYVVGLPWIFDALHGYGGTPFGLSLVILALLCALLACYVALVGWLQARSQAPVVPRLMLVAPALFAGAEMLRGNILGGFPWFSIGYTQTPYLVDIVPLAGWAPVLGVSGISLWLAVSAAAIVLLFPTIAQQQITPRSRRLLWATLVCIWGGGPLLGWMPWSQPSALPVTASLLQGNAWQGAVNPANQVPVNPLNYAQMLLESKGRLIVFPEAVLPLERETIPANFLVGMQNKARENGGDVLIGVMFRQGANSAGGTLHNAAFAVSGSVGLPVQRYVKTHLVVFGEFMPPVFDRFMRKPGTRFEDVTPGPDQQQPIRLAGHDAVIRICWEDVFGRAVAKAFSVGAEPEFIVNLSNLVWFGKSWVPDQHLQMAQMRALETSRWMLRATDSGVTAAIDHRGRIVAALPQWTRGILETSVEPRRGRTPYTIWHDWGVGVLLAGMLLLAWRLHRRAQLNG